METLKEHISNSYPESKHPINEASNKESNIYFPNVSSAMIFDFELSGQISDGYWENARPYNHWKWVCYCEIIIDKNHEIGYTGSLHRKTYSTEWLRKYVKQAIKGKAGDYDWTIRVFNYAKFGSVISKADYERADRDALRSIIEDLPAEEVTLEEFEAQVSSKDWKLEYWEKVKDIFSDALLKNYYRSSYDWSEFEDDLEFAETAINTQIYEN